MSKLDEILFSAEPVDLSAKLRIKAALYNMITESALELLESDQESTASNLMSIINKKIEEL